MSKKIDNIDVDKYIGQRLRNWRKMMGMGRKELAEQLHITDDALYRIEAGIIGLSPNHAYMLANELNCDLNFIFGREEIPSRTIEIKPGLSVVRRAAVMLRFCLEILENDQEDE